MGCSNSKIEKDEALRLCRERRRYMKQAIDYRYSLAASHVSYIESLRRLGIALRRHAEADESDKTPCLSSYNPSPSPSSPLDNALRLSYMKSSASSVTVKLDPNVRFAHEFSIPPPPPPPHFGHVSHGSWDFFDPIDDGDDDDKDGSFRFDNRGFEEGPSGIEPDDSKTPDVGFDSNKRDWNSGVKTAEREDPSEFITHRAKDFLSSIKDIEHRFFRASESGKEVAKMLEANKIRVGFSEAKGKSSALAILLVCCHRDAKLVSHDSSITQGTKVITWKRTTSSRSSSSRNPLAGASKDDGNDSGSDFAEEFCMIAGSHSSTLDRLYAWERKLYDEVKASELIRKEYDRRCEQLRYMFAKDYSSHVIDKTRAIVKDLHSRIRVAIQSVDSISKRIERMRDEELHPQLVELTQGMIRMWKSMLECHHAQYITISLAYHSKPTIGAAAQRAQAHREVADQLSQELECFGVSFADWINSLTSYVASLNSWLHNSILPPRERSKRRPFSPRRYLGPPIFTLVRDWSAEIGALPSDDLTTAIRAFLSDLHQQEGSWDKNGEPKSRESSEKESKEKEANENNENGVDIPTSSSSLSCIQATLTKVLDRLTKFSEESLKMYEDLKQKNGAAQVAYSNCKPRF